jgi:hypothetical protein
MVRTVVLVANKSFEKFKEDFESLFKKDIPYDDVVILCDFKDDVFESYFKGLLFNNIRVVRKGFRDFIESNDGVIILGL